MNENHSAFLAAKIYELLYHLSVRSETIPEQYKKILPALQDLRQNYFENKKLSFYASLCYMSESNLRKLFKEYTGMSLIEYRNQIRLENARKLIHSGTCNVSEAAYLVGFNNMSFFYELWNRNRRFS